MKTKLSENDKCRLILIMGFLTPYRNNQNDPVKRKDFDDMVFKTLEEITNYKIPDGFLDGAKP